jgi:hypothetical protein
MGNQVDWLKPLAGKPKSVQTCVLWRDEDSLMQRQAAVARHQRQQSGPQAHE